MSNYFSFIIGPSIQDVVIFLKKDGEMSCSPFPMLRMNYIGIAYSEHWAFPSQQIYVYLSKKGMLKAVYNLADQGWRYDLYRC